MSRLLLFLVAFASFNVSLHQLIHEHRSLIQCSETETHDDVLNSEIASIENEEELTAICDICDLINNHQKHVLISDTNFPHFIDTEPSQNFYTNNYSLRTAVLLHSRGPPHT